MNKLFFDIETLPAPESAESTLKYLYERKVGKIPDDSERKVETFQEFADKTSFDGAFGRIFCIAYAMNDDPIECLSNGENEKEVVQKFWEIAGRADLIIGHNIRDFDLPFIMQRSVILGVKPSWNKFVEPGKKPWDMVKFLDFARYKNAPIFDTMWEWSNWVDKWSNKGIEHLALAMGIPTPKGEGIDGSQVNEFYKAGKGKDICEYCKRDVETVRQVYKRITFESLPSTESAPF
ncbi:ribonuclease H-like domain-containing protein [Candidatus Parcubacteria bacterium]|nr:ribonuclease H-like domain-containing protein [Candidatus Parcubacteria bacterium]